MNKNCRERKKAGAHSADFNDVEIGSRVNKSSHNNDELRRSRCGVLMRFLGENLSIFSNSFILLSFLFSIHNYLGSFCLLLFYPFFSEQIFPNGGV